jgi:hypothetical protein
MKKIYLLLLVFTLGTGFVCRSQGRARNGGPENTKEQGVFKTDIPEHLFDIILGRPTNHSITLSMMADSSFSGYICYGADKSHLYTKTPVFTFLPNKVNFINLEGLRSNTRYYYKLVFTSQQLADEPEINSFHTARALGAGFTFDIQADSHLDENTSTDMYTQTLHNMQQDSTDFLIDLGDTWMTDKYRNDYKDAYKQYIAQRYYFGTVGKSAPVFLALGSHDGEGGHQLQKPDTNNMGNWATKTRRDFYPNPYPNEFYSGNNVKLGDKSYVGDYYAWQWGDALFIVLDPFRFTAANRSPWQRTLGSEQYQWLKKTLENSRARYKFVFIHSITGGFGNDAIARGGVEAAKLYEWGGADTTGVKTFAANRPDWAMPVHNLLVANKVNVVFHGHDNFFAKQDMDGIVYQLLPQPGTMRYGNVSSAIDDGYLQGKIINAPGYLRVSINASKVRIDFIQTSIDAAHINKEVLYTYEVAPQH